MVNQKFVPTWMVRNPPLDGKKANFYEYRAIGRQLVKYRQLTPLIVDQDLVVIDGVKRLMMLQAMKAETVWVRIVDDGVDRDELYLDLNIEPPGKTSISIFDLNKVDLDDSSKTARWPLSPKEKKFCKDVLGSTKIDAETFFFGNRKN